VDSEIVHMALFFIDDVTHVRSGKESELKENISVSMQCNNNVPVVAMVGNVCSKFGSPSAEDVTWTRYEHVVHEVKLWSLFRA